MIVILCQTQGRWPRNPERGEVTVTCNGVRQRFLILTPVRAQVSVPVNQSLGKAHPVCVVLYRVLAEKSGALKTENRSLTPFPTASTPAERMLLRPLRRGVALGKQAAKKCPRWED
jgi:hypothetical protein